MKEELYGGVMLIAALAFTLIAASDNPAPAALIACGVVFAVAAVFRLRCA